MKLQDVKSAGDVEIFDGEYGKISSAGDMAIRGKIRTETLKSMGDLHAAEDVIAGKIQIYGDADFKGTLTAEETQIYGDARFHQGVKIQDLKVFGNLRAQVIDADSFQVHGELEEAEALNAEKALFNGEFHVKQSMNLGKGEMNLAGKSTVKEIFCESLRVSSRESGYQGIFAGLVSRGKGGTLTVELIEGDELDLENTHCDTVRGRNIRIGKGSKIRRVEYQESLKIFEDGEVLEKEEF